MKKNKLLLATTFVGVATLLFFCGILFVQGMGQPYPERQMMVNPNPGGYYPAVNPVVPTSAPPRMIIQEKPKPGPRDQMLAQIIAIRVKRHEYDKAREIASQLPFPELAVGMILAQAENCGDEEEAGKMLDLATELLRGRSLPFYGYYGPPIPPGQPMPMPAGGVPNGVAAPLSSGAIVITQSVSGPVSVTQTQQPQTQQHLSKKASANKEKPYTSSSYSGSFYGLYPRQPQPDGTMDR